MLPSPYVFVMEEIAASSSRVRVAEDFPLAAEPVSATSISSLAVFSALFSTCFSVDDFSVDLGGIELVV